MIPKRKVFKFIEAGLVGDRQIYKYLGNNTWLKIVK